MYSDMSPEASPASRGCKLQLSTTSHATVKNCLSSVCQQRMTHMAVPALLCRNVCSICKKNLLDVSPTGLSEHFVLLSRSSFADIDECKEADDKKEDLCGVKGTCQNTNGSYWCMCSKGFTNYGNQRTTCSGEWTHTQLLYHHRRPFPHRRLLVVHPPPPSPLPPSPLPPSPLPE